MRLAGCILYDHELQTWSNAEYDLAEYGTTVDVSIRSELDPANYFLDLSQGKLDFGPDPRSAWVRFTLHHELTRHHELISCIILAGPEIGTPSEPDSEPITCSVFSARWRGARNCRN